MIAANARNEPTASVDTPVMPWPIVQPSAVTPPKPIRTRADDVVGDVLHRAEALPAERPRRQRVGRRARQHPEHAGDAERHDPRRVAPEHQQFERIGDRRDERERFHAAGIGREELFLQRRRILGDDSPRAPRRTSRRRSTRPITMPPTISSGDARNSRSLNTNTASAAASTNGSPSFATAGAPSAAASAGRSDVAAPIAGDVEAPRVERVDAPHGEQTLQRHVGGDAQHQHHDHGLEVAGAGADQRLAAAARRQRHPEAEQEAADEARHPRAPAAPCRWTWPVSIRPAATRDSSTGNGYGDSEHPHTHAPPVAELDDVDDRAHRAEVDAVGDRAEDEGQRERQARDQQRQIGLTHPWPEIISCTPTLRAAPAVLTPLPRPARFNVSRPVIGTGDDGGRCDGRRLGQRGGAQPRQCWSRWGWRPATRRRTAVRIAVREGPPGAGRRLRSRRRHGAAGVCEGRAQLHRRHARATNTAVRIRNCTGARVLVVTSVDGVNVISGDTAAPSQSGYVLEPWGSVEITGWRKSMDRTAAFYFTDLGDSYAARTGRPQNVGVIGVAVFQEKTQPIAMRDYKQREERQCRGRSAGLSANRGPFLRR